MLMQPMQAQLPQLVFQFLAALDTQVAMYGLR
jgi:hypothetical protein